MFAGDAPEIDHAECVWNATTELVNRVDSYITRFREEKLGTEEVVPDEISNTIYALRRLRLVCREIALQLDLHRRQRTLAKKPFLLKCAKEAAGRFWPRIVQDIDNTMHGFTHRHDANPPKFRAAMVRHKGPATSMGDEDDGDISKSVTESNAKRKEIDERINVEALGKGFHELLLLQPFQKELVVADSISLANGDEILIRLKDRQVVGSIIEVVDQMKAVYVSYEGLSTFFDEFRPFSEIKQSEEEGDRSPSSLVSEDQSGNGRNSETVVLSAIGGRGEVRSVFVLFWCVFQI